MLIVNTRIGAHVCLAKAVRRMTYSKMENFTTSTFGGFSLGGFPITDFWRISSPDFWRFFGESISQLSFQKPICDFLELGNMIKHIVFIWL
jgi:hypothetical protein